LFERGEKGGQEGEMAQTMYALMNKEKKYCIQNKELFAN
jgi:hypothetical protein